MGQAPGTGEVSLRTFPRNFPGRSGARDDKVYLCSPETATAAAIKGVITDPRDIGKEMAYPKIEDPKEYRIDEQSIIFLSEELAGTEVIRGPNIKPLPKLEPPSRTLWARSGPEGGGHVNGRIMPAETGAVPVEYRHSAGSCSAGRPELQKNAMPYTVLLWSGGRTTDGSSREHAALAPRYLGVRAKIAKSSPASISQPLQLGSCRSRSEARGL
jgi:aconitate hydratase